LQRIFHRTKTYVHTEPLAKSKRLPHRQSYCNDAKVDGYGLKKIHHIFGTSTATMQRFKGCQSQICQQPLNTAGTFDIAKVFEMWNSQALGNIGQRPSESQPEHRKSICTGAKPFYDSKPDHDLPVGDLRPGSPLVNDLPMYICQYVHQKKRMQRCNVSIYTRILLCSAVLLAGISTLSGARSP